MTSKDTHEKMNETLKTRCLHFFYVIFYKMKLCATMYNFHISN